MSSNTAIIERNISESDAVAAWFATLEELAEPQRITYAKLNDSEDHEPEFFDLSHCEYDGIGGLVYLFKKSGFENIPEPPLLKNKSKPTFSEFSKSYWEYLSTPSRPKIHWKENVISSKKEKIGFQETPTVMAWKVFDSSQTQALIDQAKKQGVTLNSFLLSQLSAAIRPDLLDENIEIPWMVPVNMRGGQGISSEIPNISSFIEVRVGPKDLEKRVHEKVTNALLRKHHWGVWYASQIGLWIGNLGRRLLIQSQLKSGQMCIGSFSNLGAWKLSTNSIWLFCPPVIARQPIGVGCVTINGNLSLLVQAHKSLTTDSKVLQNWLDRLLNNN